MERCVIKSGDIFVMLTKNIEEFISYIRYNKPGYTGIHEIFSEKNGSFKYFSCAASDRPLSWCEEKGAFVFQQEEV